MPWSAFDGHTLTIGRSRTKATARRSRVITVPRVTAQELRAWQLESGGRGAEPITGEMTPNAMKLWGRRRLPKGVRLYDLRHAHASACHYDGLTLPEVARRLGHSQHTHILHYAHVIEELTGQRYDGLDAMIEAARADLMFRQCSASGPRRETYGRRFARNRPISRAFASSPLSDSNRRPLPYHDPAGRGRCITDPDLCCKHGLG